MSSLYKKIPILLIFIFLGIFSIVLSRDIASEIEVGNVMQLANKGSPKEQLRLALMYQTGKFVEKNEEKAVFWFVKAASNGSKTAKNILCWHYNHECDSG